MDLGDRSTRYCVLDKAGDVILERSVPLTKKGMDQVFGTMPCSPSGSGNRCAFSLGQPAVEPTGT